MGKITIEEEAQETRGARIKRRKKGQTPEERSEVLDQGRILGPLKRSFPETFERLEMLSQASGKRKVEIFAEAIDFYYENQVLGAVWAKIQGVSPDQLQACWMLFRYFQKEGFNIYMTLGKEFLEGSVRRYHEMIEQVKAQAWLEAKQYYEAQLERERRRYEMEKERELRRLREEKTSKIAKKIDAIMDVLIDSMSDMMLQSFIPKNKVKKIKPGIKVSVKGL